MLHTTLTESQFGRFNPQLACDLTSPSARIVATIGGEESPNFSNLEKTLGHGTIRINLAFCTPQRYETLKNLIRRIREEGGKGRINILLDAVGPRVKLGSLPEGGILLEEGKEVTLTTRKVEASSQILPVLVPSLPSHVQVGHPIILAEGKFKLEVTKKENESDFKCKVIVGGQLKKRGINLPLTNLPIPALSDEDKLHLAELLKEKAVNMVALSFVRNKEDVLLLRSFLDEQGRKDVKIMSKIETTTAVTNIIDITSVSDALMVARGDLWAELVNPWTLPQITTKITQTGNSFGIPVVVATQALSTMTSSPLPSRAEVDEIYFLLSQGADCIMGSEEFAVGKYAKEVISSIQNVSRQLDLERISNPPPRSLNPKSLDRNLAAIMWAEGTPRVRCVVIISCSGKFLTEVYQARCVKPLVVITNNPRAACYFQLFQVYPVVAEFTPYDDGSAIARAALKTMGWTGDDQSALLIVNHVGPDTTKKHRFSRIEEIPLPSSPDVDI
eukprot:TRINITY_DN3489_c1_g8_i1.p1 TRINITY_DN3489_c1_g8~~TRINITY_DN3489_c1_g8_i1.p1  ORF type:complete len:540 (-),score=199.59 TRINITY_DN3489_c1_g8_i1:106-1611(-)